MVGYILNVVYLALIVAASPLLIYSAIRKGKYREGFAEKFLGRVPKRDGQRTCIWFHAVSVGEVQLLGPLLAELQQRAPDVEAVISTTTKTGFALAKKKHADALVFYCPLDFTWATASAMQRIRPDLLVLAELELWPNLVAAARNIGARLAVVNGRLSENSFRGYRRIRPLVARLLRSIDRIATQTPQYAERFTELGAEPDRVIVTGSIKFDGAQSVRNNPRTSALRELAGITPKDAVFLAGSTQSPEESMALQTFKTLKDENPNLRLILVPRHPERFEEVKELLDASGMPWQRRSDLETVGRRPAARILLVDTVGELGAWWGTAQIGFVGGSFGSRGGQNMIEPAAYGTAVSFGPNTQNFRDVVAALLADDAAVVVHSQQEMSAFVRRCLVDSDYASALGSRAARVVAASRGATGTTVSMLFDLLPQQDEYKAAA